MEPGVGYRFSSSSSGITLDIGDPWPTKDSAAFECSPYKVHDVQLKAGEGGDYVVFQICSATFNNVVPQVYDSTNETWQYLDELAEDAELVIDFASTSTAFIYLRVGPDATTKVFPPLAPDSTEGDPYPRIYSTGEAFPADTNELAYLKIAKVTQVSAGVYTVDQYVTGSLWGDRIQIGAGETMKSYYYYARI